MCQLPNAVKGAFFLRTRHFFFFQLKNIRGSQDHRWADETLSLFLFTYFHKSEAGRPGQSFRATQTFRTLCTAGHGRVTRGQTQQPRSGKVEETEEFETFGSM